MNSKTSTFFVMTLVAILSVSIVTVRGIQSDAADKNDDDHDDRKKLKFNKKPSFISEICIRTGFAEDFLPAENYDVSDCKMKV